MSKDKPNITLNFYGPVGQQIANVETQTVYVGKDGKIDIANVEQSVPAAPVAQANPQSQPHYPRENDYISVAQWLDEQKQLGIDYFKEAGGNRAQLCRNLTKLFHWVVDPNSLGKQMRNYDFT